MVPPLLYIIGGFMMANSNRDSFVNDIIQKMTLDEKIGQMTQVDRQFIQTSDISEYFIGSLLSGGGSTPKVNEPKAWADMVDEYQKEALKTRLKIPIIYGIDAVHGHNNVIGAVVFPHNIGLGCMRNPELVSQAAAVTAEEVIATGIHWTFAPCLAISRDERWGRAYESFGETPELVTSYTSAAIQGFQGKAVGEKGKILACAKHFAGDGGTVWGTGLKGKMDRGNTILDDAEFRRIHVAPYLPAIEAGAGSIMASFNSWNGEKAHGQKEMLTGMIKEEFGFQGFIVSDWEGIDEIPGDYKSDIIKGVNAGLDMIMVPGAVPYGGESFKTFLKLFKESVLEGSISMSRIDDAVKRILNVKYDMGLFEHPLADRSKLNNIGTKAHREVARQCVRESVVLLKNDNNILPLNKEGQTILVVGKNANNLGYQCGGWTISWQGSSGDITDGTTIFDGIKEISKSEVILSENGENISNADVIIAVIGEKPYAEMEGDRADLKLDKSDVALLEKIQKSGKPVIVILVTGRPLMISSYLNDWDALVSAWLPGTEGNGVADVLFGDYSPTGKLSVTWPKSMDQIPINIGDKVYNPLFEFGFG
ncbi:MAG: glycoside hydrolase family 3 C-terminal domain-containing protein, partial [Candidatus Marinimicrobia bacterium]|nr:glycoside hydrolase family 3 C-terminal domain-containing protein [Candidatus Neomarinimicrobiota bacterium]